MAAENRCVYCGKAASAYSLISDGEERKIFLCPACYHKMFAAQEGREEKDKKVCPSCGTSPEDYRRTGLWGCPDCYRVFREELLSTLRSVQGKLRHEGKRPLAPTTDLKLVLRRIRLKEQLEQAIRDKNYAYADELTEELSKLTRQNRGA